MYNVKKTVVILYSMTMFIMSRSRVVTFPLLFMFMTANMTQRGLLISFALSASSSPLSSPSAVVSPLTKAIELQSFQSMEEIVCHFLEKTMLSEQGTTTSNDAANKRAHKTNKKRPILLLDKGCVSAHVHQHFDTILFDCDGVLYRGSHLIPNMVDTMNSLLLSGKQVFFVTNNAGNSRFQLQQKLQQLLGVTCQITQDQIISSSYSCAKYIKEKESHILSLRQHSDTNTQQKVNVYVVGTQGLCQELENFGFNVLTYTDKQTFGMNRDELASYEFDDQSSIVDVVVCGLDTDFNYRKLCIVTNILDQKKDAIFLATNKDAFDLVGNAPIRKLPGNGSIVTAIETASQRTAINVGKPSAFLSHLILNKNGASIDPLRTLMVGDRLDTDIAFAKLGGMSSALVLTGVTTAKKIIELDNEGDLSIEGPMPDLIFPHAGLMA